MLLDLGLGEGDFVLDGVEFLVGLDRHRLLAEFRQAALLHRDVFFERGARVLVGGELLLGGGDVLPRGLEPRFERQLVLGLGGELLARGVGGAIEFLQGDESFEVGVHGPEAKKGPAEAERSMRSEVYMSSCGESPAFAACGYGWALHSNGLADRSSLATSAARAKVGPPGFEPGTGRL